MTGTEFARLVAIVALAGLSAVGVLLWLRDCLRGARARRALQKESSQTQENVPQSRKKRFSVVISLVAASLVLLASGVVIGRVTSPTGTGIGDSPEGIANSRLLISDVFQPLNKLPHGTYRFSSGVKDEISYEQVVEWTQSPQTVACRKGANPLVGRVLRFLDKRNGWTFLEWNYIKVEGKSSWSTKSARAVSGVRSVLANKSLRAWLVVDCVDMVSTAAKKTKLARVTFSLSWSNPLRSKEFSKTKTVAGTWSTSVSTWTTTPTTTVAQPSGVGSGSSQTSPAAPSYSYSQTCVTLRSLYNQASRATTIEEFDAPMNEAVSILRSIGWGMTADWMVEFAVQGRIQESLQGLRNYFNAYNCG